MVQVGNEITNGFMWAPPVADCSEGGATWRPGNQSSCDARCLVNPGTGDKAKYLRCRYMCGASAASDCGPDAENKTGGWSKTCALAFVDQKWHCSNWPHFVTILNATIGAVRDASPSTQVMVHGG